jgi:hypothetical protein
VFEALKLFGFRYVSAFLLAHPVIHNPLLHTAGRFEALTAMILKTTASGM